MINNKTIKNFRSYINKNNNFIYSYFKDRGKKNHWNCICSCMDWIDVAIAQISHLQQKEVPDDINVHTMEVYSLISAIDVINESITQLSRVITGSIAPPFKGKSDIFSKPRQFKGDSDEDYFKHIRAVFGAHPINLNKNKEKWFASWPTKGIWNEYDFECLLYSANIEKKDITFGFKFDELNKFLISRYAYLDELILKLEKIKNKAVNENIHRIIKSFDNPLEQLYHLKEEAELRFDVGYYHHNLDLLISFFETDRTYLKNEEVLDRYFEGLATVIEELRYNMQTMSSNELVTDDILYPDIPQNLSYAFAKVSDSFYSNKPHLAYEYLVKEIQDELKSVINFPNNTSMKEDYLLIHAGFYISSKKF